MLPGATGGGAGACVGAAVGNLLGGGGERRGRATGRDSARRAASTQREPSSDEPSTRLVYRHAHPLREALERAEPSAAAAVGPALRGARRARDAASSDDATRRGNAAVAARPKNTSRWRCRRRRDARARGRGARLDAPRRRARARRARRARGGHLEESERGPRARSPAVVRPRLCARPNPRRVLTSSRHRGQTPVAVAVAMRLISVRPRPIASTPGARAPARPAPAGMATPSAEAEELKAEGNRLYQRGKYAAAIDAYTLAVTAAPRWISPYVNRALCHRKLKRWEGVRDDCVKALEIDRENIKANYMLGLSLIFEKKHTEVSERGGEARTRRDRRDGGIARSSVSPSFAVGWHPEPTRGRGRRSTRRSRLSAEPLNETTRPPKYKPPPTPPTPQRRPRRSCRKRSRTRARRTRRCRTRYGASSRARNTSSGNSTRRRARRGTKTRSGNFERRAASRGPRRRAAAAAAAAAVPTTWTSRWRTRTRSRRRGATRKARGGPGPGQARPIHWFPYDRVGVVNADP